MDFCNEAIRPENPGLDSLADARNARLFLLLKDEEDCTLCASGISGNFGCVTAAVTGTVVAEIEPSSK